MPIIFAGGSAGMLVRVTCPHCGEVQARVRARDGEAYTCRRCQQKFFEARDGNAESPEKKG